MQRDGRLIPGQAVPAATRAAPSRAPAGPAPAKKVHTMSPSDCPSVPPPDPDLCRRLASRTPAQIREIPCACAECQAALDAYLAYLTADRPTLSDLTGRRHEGALDASIAVRQHFAASLDSLAYWVGELEM